MHDGFWSGSPFLDKPVIADAPNKPEASEEGTVIHRLRFHLGTARPEAEQESDKEPDQPEQVYRCSFHC